MSVVTGTVSKVSETSSRVDALLDELPPEVAAVDFAQVCVEAGIGVATVVWLVAKEVNLEGYLYGYLAGLDHETLVELVPLEHNDIGSVTRVCIQGGSREFAKEMLKRQVHLDDVVVCLSEGVLEDEIRAIADLRAEPYMDTYLRGRRKGFTHLEMVDALQNDISLPTYMMRNDYTTHADIMDARARRIRLNQYTHVRTWLITHAQVVEAWDAGTDLEDYKYERHWGRTHEQSIQRAKRRPSPT